jgi:hypothetical protein
MNASLPSLAQNVAHDVFHLVDLLLFDVCNIGFKQKLTSARKIKPEIDVNFGNPIGQYGSALRGSHKRRDCKDQAKGRRDNDKPRLPARKI